MTQDERSILTALSELCDETMANGGDRVCVDGIASLAAAIRAALAEHVSREDRQKALMAMVSSMRARSPDETIVYSLRARRLLKLEDA